MNNSKFCFAPFREALIDTDGSMMPCCEYKIKSNLKFNQFDEWWDNETAPVRDDFINDVHNEGCTYCKDKEKIPGGTRHRVNVNSRYTLTLTPEEQANPTRRETPEFLEIRFGNYCNLRCIMCGPYASSSIAQEINENRGLYFKNKINYRNSPTIRWWEEPGALDKLKHLAKNAKHLSFTGGEPMMIPEVFDILSDADPSCNISFSTNLTRLNSKLLNVFEKFELIKLSVSLEGVGAHNDYIRHGSEWNQIIESIKILKQRSNVRINIAHVMQHTTVFAFPKLSEFLEEYQLLSTFNAVYHPPGFLGADSIHPRDMDSFREYLVNHPHKTIESWLENYKFDEYYHKNFKNYVAMLDQIRGTDFHVVFSPQWD
jgi:MoaA/NifB/PqqE/SkfB family radical SAM enzyme